MRKFDPNILYLVLFAIVAFAVDYATGSGMAGAALYPAVVAAASLGGNRVLGFSFAGACSLLAAFALFLAALQGGGSSDAQNILMLINRGIVLAAIWGVAVLGLQFGVLHAKIAELDEQLHHESAELRNYKFLQSQTEQERDAVLEELQQSKQQRQSTEAEAEQAAQSLKESERARRRTEATLLDFKGQYVSLIESLALHVIRKDAQGRFTYASPSFCNLVGLTLDDIRGKTDLELFPDKKDIVVKYMEDDRKVIETKEKFEDVEEHPGDKYMQVIKTPIIDTKGNAVGVQCVFWDVTDRKRAEIEREKAETGMREGEARKRAIFEFAMDCILFIDQDGCIVECNRASEDTFGYSRRDLIGQEMAEILVPEKHRVRVRSNLAKFAKGRSASMIGERLDFSMVTKAGREFVTELATQPIPLPGGTTGFAVFIRDITQRKAQEKALKKAKDAAESASRSKGAFLANMSHEIRTPMNAVIGMTEFVLDTELREEQREYLEMVLESSNSLLALLNDILDFSKIEAGKMDLEELPFEFRRWLNDCIKSMAFRAKQNDLYFRCEVSKSTPEHLVGDPNRLRQIIANLVSNALKFTHEGGITLKVRPVKQDEKQALLLFEVIDTGIGIAPEKCKTVFQEFEQADNSTKRRYGGTGLGLAICSKLAALMHGQMGLKSVVGRGSTFQFTAQFGVRSEAIESPREAKERASALAARAAQLTAPMRILLAEDSPMNQRLAIGLLQRKGHEVVVASNGLEAVEAFKKDHFDIVLMDVQMPEMDGYDATREIRSLESGDNRIPIIAMTAHAMKGDRELCLKAGMDDYLSKPIRAKDLYDMIAGYAPQDATAESEV